MPRARRLLIPGAAYHIYARGNHRRAVFHDDEDRAWFMNRLAKIEAGVCALHFAHCLMSNHLHLVVRPSEDTLSTLMHRVLGPYAQWFNKRHGMVGHVFQGRFGSRPVLSDFDLLTVIRYVHRNPVDAGLVRSASDWAWSSHRDYLAARPGPAMESVVLAARALLDPRPERALHAYRRMLRAGADGEAPIPVLLHGEGILGDLTVSVAKDTTITTTASKVSLEELAVEFARNHEVELDALRARHGPRSLSLPRYALCRVAVREFGFSVKEMARFLNRVPSAVSNILVRGDAGARVA